MRPTLLCLLAVLLLAPASLAGTITFIPINNDADSGIDYTKIYTHTMDLGAGDGGAIVNLVPFTQVVEANVDSLPNFSYTISSGTRNTFGLNTAHIATGEVAGLFNDFMYNGGNDPGGVATLTLTGLTPGATYDTRIYARQWGPSPDRISQIDFDNDGVAGADDSVTLNQDDASANPPGFAVANQPYALSYQFTAQTSELTVSFNQAILNYSWHQYAVTNEIVGSNNGRVPIEGLFNSGVDAAGMVLAPGEVDPRYELVGTGPATVALGHPAYLANDATGTEGSSWIGPIADLSANLPVGEYRFRTEFDLSGYVPGSAEVYVQVAVDNELTDILVNGNSTGLTAVGFNMLQPTLILDDELGPGVNTLEFVTVNGGDAENPFGFRVELSGTALVPEPSTFAMTIVGLFGLLLWVRRKRAT